MTCKTNDLQMTCKTYSHIVNMRIFALTPSRLLSFQETSTIPTILVVSGCKNNFISRQLPTLVIEKKTPEPVLPLFK